jgi:hypothetical protein
VTAGEVQTPSPRGERLEIPYVPDAVEHADDLVDARRADLGAGAPGPASTTGRPPLRSARNEARRKHSRCFEVEQPSDSLKGNAGARSTARSGVEEWTPHQSMREDSFGEPNRLACASA